MVRLPNIPGDRTSYPTYNIHFCITMFSKHIRTMYREWTQSSRHLPAPLGRWGVHPDRVERDMSHPTIPYDHCAGINASAAGALTALEPDVVPSRVVMRTPGHCERCGIPLTTEPEANQELCTECEHLIISLLVHCPH